MSPAYPGCPACRVPGVTMTLGDVSGEKTMPTAYSERFSPYFLTRFRSTSRISMSKTISARGLSFCATSRSMISTTGRVPRTMSVLPVLFAWIIGMTAIPGTRITELINWLSSVESACDR